MELLPDHIRIVQRAYWLTKIRWGAIAGVVLVTFFAVHILQLEVEELYLYLVAGILNICNVIYLLLLKRAEKLDKDRIVKFSKRVINFQISADLLSLTALLHFSGGIENPCIVFYIFHMVIASALLSSKESYLQTTFALILFILMTYFEYAGIIEHHSLNKFISELLLTDTMYLLFAIIIFVIASYLVVYMSNSISTQLRYQEEAYRMANIELEEKDKIKNEYVSRITHDIKGHLAVILSCLSVLSKRLFGPLEGKNAEFIDRAYNRTVKLTQFVKELLHLTNIRMSKEFEMSTFSLKDSILDVVNTVKTNAEQKSIHLSCNIDKNVKNIEGYQFSIEEVFSNLLLNAVKYTLKNGKVGIDAKIENDYAHISVYDNGLGIPKEEIPNVFEEFYRASNVKKIVKDGTGLGLSLVKQIIERHNGEIHIESELNNGTKFIVKLPLKQD